MKKLLALISDSYHEFKHVSTITTCAMFGAMSIVLNQLATIRVTPNLKIGFGALPNELVDYLFGPVVGAGVFQLTASSIFSTSQPPHKSMPPYVRQSPAFPAGTFRTPPWPWDSAP